MRTTRLSGPLLPAATPEAAARGCTDLILLGRQLMKIGEDAMRGDGGSLAPTGQSLVLRDVFANSDSSITDITARTKAAAELCLGVGRDGRASKASSRRGQIPLTADAPSSGCRRPPARRCTQGSRLGRSRAGRHLWRPGRPEDPRKAPRPRARLRARSDPGATRRHPREKAEDPCPIPDSFVGGTAKGRYGPASAGDRLGPVRDSPNPSSPERGVARARDLRPIGSTTGRVFGRLNRSMPPAGFEPSD
jgi:hypothetical protein